MNSLIIWRSISEMMPECPLLVCLPTWMSTTYQQWCVWLWLWCISAQLLPPVQLSTYGTSVYSTCWSVVLYCGVQVSIDAAVSLETSSFTANLQSCFISLASVVPSRHSCTCTTIRHSRKSRQKIAKKHGTLLWKWQKSRQNHCSLYSC